MAIRYTNFADGDVLTAEQMLDVQDNGVVHVDSYAELNSLASGVSTAFVISEGAFYIQKSDGTWATVGGLATVAASAPTSPVTGELWFDTDEIMPEMQKVTKAGLTSITTTGFTAVNGFNHVTVNATEAIWVEISYGFTNATGASSADGLSVKVDITGATTRVAGAEDYATGSGTTPGSAMNTFAVVLNDGNNDIQMFAKKNGTGTTEVNNPWILIKPIRWA